MEMHGLTTVLGIRHNRYNRIYYYNWLMGGERIQRKLKKFKGKQLAGKCTEPERNNKEKGSEWKTERIVIS